MKGLFIQQPWIDMILCGEKTWDIRSQPIEVCDGIALIDELAGAIVAIGRIVGCLGPSTFEQLLLAYDRHRIPPATLRELVKERFGNKAYAWVFDDIRRLANPVPIKRGGPGIWMFVHDLDVPEAADSPSR